MDRTFVIRALSLYVPLVGACGTWAWRKPETKEAAGALLATAWNLPFLLALNIAAQRFDWWHFNAKGALFLNVPVDLWLGWSVLWGALAALIFRARPAALIAFVLGMLDAILMPLCAPVVVLGSRWIIGECLGLAVCLIPAQLFAAWTRDQRHVVRRAVLQFFCFNGLLALLTLLLLDQTGSFRSLSGLTARDWRIWTQLILVITLPGLSALQEFATRGAGTPLPFDAPSRLVQSGIYAYVANPMQVATVLLFAALALVLHSLWFMVAALITFLYSAGLADWFEGEELTQRHGASFHEYRRHVRNWIPRWRPYVPHPASLYVSAECGRCSQLAGWLHALKPVGLEIVAAEEHPERDLTRMTYDPQDGTAEQSGITALARAFEHINFGWALLGMAMRLPGVCGLLQAIADVNGGAPTRVVRKRPVEVCSIAASTLPSLRQREM